MAAYSDNSWGYFRFMAISHLPRYVRYALLAFIVLAIGAAAFSVYGSLVPGRRTAVDAAAMARIQPHRAIYNMTLQRAKQGSSVNNVGGRMMFAWADACDAWTIEQRLDLTFQYEGGRSQRVKTSLATWEAKDSSLFRFNVRRETNGAETEAFRGRAILARDGSGGEANYQPPTAHDVALRPQTVFPSTHTLELLEAARKGEHMLTRDVFDGADEQGKNEISAFISDPQPVTAPEGAANAALRTGEAWPIRMAFFAPDNQTGTPDYEMTMQLLQNGVATSLTIDYGDFVVDATLDTLEPLPEPTCS